MTARERVEWSSQDVGSQRLSLRSQPQSGSEVTSSQRQQEPQVTPGKLKFEAILSSNRHREVMTALVALQTSLQTLGGQVEEIQKSVQNLQNQRQMLGASDQGYEDDCESVSQYLCRKKGREKTPEEASDDDDDDDFENNENDGLFASNLAQHDPSPPMVNTNSAPRPSGQSQVETVIDGGYSQPSQTQYQQHQPLPQRQYQQQPQQQQPQQQQRKQQQQQQHHVTSSSEHSSRESPWISNEDSFDESQHHHGWGKRGVRR